MKLKIALPMLMLLGCGPVVTEPMPDIPQTVEYETVRVEYGTTDLLDAPADARQQPLVGEASELALLTQGFVRGTNKAIRDQIQLVERVSADPPTAYADGVWTWEYASATEYFLFQITEGADGGYSYSFSTGTDASTALVVFDGQFQPREGRLLRQSGTGILRFHFDNIPQPGPQKASGTISDRVSCDRRRAASRTHFLDFTEGVEPPLTAAYDYIQLRSGQGRFRYSARQDFKRTASPMNWWASTALGQRNRLGESRYASKGAASRSTVLFDECWIRWA
ncbi:MAG: hypothetical protein R3E66_03450 [bacterium]